MSTDWTLTDRVPTPGEHRRLAESVGWKDAFDQPSLPASLAGSSLGVVASIGTQVIGMGRVVGDGVKYFYIQDVAVDPAHQGAGVGRAILERLVELIARAAPAPAFVALFATAAGEPLYRSLGFESGDMTGMFTIIDPAVATERAG
ncbi:GNAT family N-acetyltransferase [Brachybacterium hainanense]|uniref:GNAT family N-acetyltransferase n=1 Tax=Brachybacterium hainanense TaxID=1541174 RepID=A0ABV6R9R0_9MICO